MVDKRVVKKSDEKMADLSDDPTLKILYKQCKASGPCKLSKTGLFIAGAQEGLGASAALDSFHLHLFRKSGKVAGLATFLGKDMGLTGAQRGEKMHEEISDFENPPDGIPEPLKEVSEYVATLLDQIKKGELTAEEEE